METRHFWRRAIAVLIDFLILSQLAFYLTVPFADGDRVRLSGGVYQSVACKTVPLAEGSQDYFSELGIEAENANLCTTYQNGFFAGSNLLVSSDINDAGEIANNAITASVPIGRQGEGVEPIYPVANLAPVMVILGIILMTWMWRGQTLGKKITRVQVVAQDGSFLTFVQVVRREGLKFFPAIVLFVIGFVMPEYTLEHIVPMLRSGQSITVLLGYLGVSTFVYIIWWVAPLIWWNGTMPYDRINKSLVERYYG